MECYETICKIGTGFSDERLEQIHKFLSDHKMNEPLLDYKTNGFVNIFLNKFIYLNYKEVDVWFEPCCVWEIKGADMQISPVYTAGIGDIDAKKV